MSTRRAVTSVLPGWLLRCVPRCVPSRSPAVPAAFIWVDHAVYIVQKQRCRVSAPWKRIADVLLPQKGFDHCDCAVLTKIDATAASCIHKNNGANQIIEARLIKHFFCYFSKDVHHRPGWAYALEAASVVL